MSRDRHQSKDVERALQHVEALGWTVIIKHSGHVWGNVRCGSGCKVGIPSTPRNPTGTAKRVRKAGDRCPH